MPTPEEILSKKNWSTEYPNYMAEHEILEAMNVYAQQEKKAIADTFLQWLDKETKEVLKLTKVSPDSDPRYWVGALDVLELVREKFLTLTPIDKDNNHEKRYK